MRQFMHRVYLIAAIISFLFICAGCASLHTVDKYADGRTTETDVFEVGRTEAITALTDATTPTGRTIAIGSAQSDVNTEALKATTGALGVIVGEALKTATKP